MKNHIYIFIILSLSTFLLKGSIANAQQLRQNNNNIDNIDPCKGQCKNGSTCVKGIAEAPSNLSSGNRNVGDDVYHCQCSYGWTGVRCDIIYESCSLESSPESSTETSPNYHRKCYNNGECVPGLFDEYGHEQLFCDCTNATDEDGMMYVGKYCEHQAIDYCNDGHFCLNGAQCNDNYPDFGEPCSCYGDYEGPHCEIKKYTYPESSQSASQNSIENSTNDFVPECDLNCANGGYCVIYTSVENKDVENHGINNINGNYKFCKCPEGYDGPTCDIQKEDYEKEYEEEVYEETENFFKDGEDKECIGNNCEKNKIDAEQCGKGYCYNGGTCVKSSIFTGNGNDDEQVYCDCTTAIIDEDIYAGRYCQYKATAYCTNNPSLNHHLFCVNGGQCKDDKYRGCDCPDGFGGFSCEFKKDNGNHATTITSTNLVSSNENPSTIDSASSYDPSSTGLITTVAGIDTKPGSEINPNQIIVEIQEDIELENSKCGDGYCANGSECISPTAHKKDDYCDCDTVTTDDALFAGRFCQYKATSYCSKNVGINHHLFCVNGGSCKEDMYNDSNGSIGCDCKEGFSGFNCEITAEESSKIDTEEENNFDENDYEDESKEQPKEITLDNSFGSLSLPQQSQEEDEIITSSGNNGDDKKEYSSTKPEMNSNSPNTLPVDKNGESILVSSAFDDPNYTQCDSTKCMNGGICRKGAKQRDSEKLTEIVRDIDHLNATYDPKDFDHCVCRPGFTGLRCEHEIETCGDDSDSADVNVNGEGHFCLHGSKCIKLNENDNLEQQHGCDCSTTTSAISPAFAGKSCEHKSTSICTIGEILPGKPLSFCVNGGSCLKEVSDNERHAGCDCPANWSGPHCEIRLEGDNAKEEKKQTESTLEANKPLEASLSKSHDEIIPPAGSLDGKSKILSRLIIIVGCLVVILITIAYVNQRQHHKKCASEMTSFLTNQNSNSAYFTNNQLHQTPDNSINLAPKQDCNYDGIPVHQYSIADATAVDYQPDPVDVVIDGMGKTKGIGMESSDSMQQSSTGRKRRGGTNHHQIL